LNSPSGVPNLRARADAIERDRWDEQEGDLTMGSAEKLARCYQQTDNHPLAIDVLKLALEDNALYRRRLPERAQYLALLTDSHLTLKNDSEAAAAAKEAIELADLMVTDDPRHTAVVCFVLGKVYRDHNRQDEARRLLQRAVDLAAEHLPETDNDRSQMQRELALFWIRDGKLQEAEALLQQTIAELLKNPVPDRHTLVSCHLSLASLALKKEAPQETLVHCEEVRRLCKQYQWEEHYENARSYVLSGLAHIKMKQLVKAREDLQVARSIMQGSLGAEHPDVLTVKRALAELSKGQSQQAGPGGTEVKAAPQ
jgi:tetratricopeptide (TPR) repeat protein